MVVVVSVAYVDLVGRLVAFLWLFGARKRSVVSTVYKQAPASLFVLGDVGLFGASNASALERWARRLGQE
jgi:hypothetical protein